MDCWIEVLDATEEEEEEEKSFFFFLDFLICQKNFLELLIGFGEKKNKKSK